MPDGPKRGGCVNWANEYNRPITEVANRLGFHMQYADGRDIKPGDVIQIDSRYRGTVVASMDLGEYLPGEESWSYLKEGIMVDTDFGGLVHYTKNVTDDLVLIKRADSTDPMLHTRPQAGE